MCVTAAGRVIAIDGDQATVECGGVALQVSTRMVRGLVAGDHVLVGYGVIIARLTPAEAEAMSSDLARVGVRPPTGARPREARGAPASPPTLGTRRG